MMWRRSSRWRPFISSEGPDGVELDRGVGRSLEVGALMVGISIGEPEGGDDESERGRRGGDGTPMVVSVREGWASVIECRRLHGDGFCSGGELGSYGLDDMEPVM
jgi:hypothetical protein